MWHLCWAHHETPLSQFTQIHPVCKSFPNESLGFCFCAQRSMVMICCRTLLPSRRMQTSLGRLCLSSGRMQSPRGSNCGSLGSSCDGDRHMHHSIETCHRSLLPLATITLLLIVTPRIRYAASEWAPWHTYARCHGGSSFGCENSPIHTHATYHLCSK